MLEEKEKSHQELNAELKELKEKYDALKASFDSYLQDRISTEATLFRSENRYKKLAEQIDAIVWRYDLKNDNWIYVSPQTERILGYSPDEWINFQWWVDIMHPDDRAWAPSFCLNETKRGAWHEFEYRLRHKNGKEVWIYDKVSVETLNGEPVFLFGAMFDVTRHKLEEISNHDFASRKLETAIENVKASIVITDSEGVIEFANSFFTELTGFSPGDLKGKTPGVLKSGVQSQEFYEKLWQTIKSGNTWRGEMCNKKKNGELYWEFATISPIKNEEDVITNFVGVKTDITPLKKLNEQLQAAKYEAEENRVRFEALHNATFGGIGIHDQGVILDCNFGLSQMTGYSVEELIGMNGLLLIAEEFREKVMNNIKAGEDKPYEAKGLRKSGEEYPLRLEGRNIPYKGKTVRVVEFRDITERKRHEHIIEQQNRELQNLNADKDRFISVLAHDLKGPMGGVLGLTQLMVNNSGDYSPDKMLNLSKTVNETTQNAFNLLDDLLSWVRTQSGKTPFSPRNIRLKDLCDDIAGLLSSNSETKNIVVDCHIDEQLIIFADNDMLKTILRNLVSNGIKFTNYGGKVVVSAKKKDDSVLITVSDTGVGIKPEKIEQLFEGLQNYSEPGTAKEKGTGFGLLLCKEFVQKHGGTIWVDSKVGHGSDFHFQLPLRAEKKDG